VARDLVYREELVVELRERFRRWNREMPEINKRQAYVIDGADILPNPNGSAVGMMFENGTPPSRRPPAQEAGAGRPRRSRRDGGVPTEDCVSMDAGVTLIVLPGPPREMQPMFENFVLPVGINGTLLD
jgi:nicotinamide-nucleotide amidase